LAAKTPMSGLEKMVAFMPLCTMSRACQGSISQTYLVTLRTAAMPGRAPPSWETGASRPGVVARSPTTQR
jgi:hypothetical protein